MADNVAITAGAGTTIAADEVTDGTLGTCKVGYVKIMDGTIDGTAKAAVGVNGLACDVKASALPSGASTSAKQPALGTAGTASADVITVQGITSMTPLLVTASAGTNLNTSALALEAGNLATLAGIITSSRAAVNPISGQAGVAGGAGASGATTQRTVVANDTGRTLAFTGGSASSSGNNTLLSAGTNKLKVYAFSLTTVSATAMTCIFQSGASGTELWRVVLMAISDRSNPVNARV